MILEKCALLVTVFVLLGCKAYASKLAKDSCEGIRMTSIVKTINYHYPTRPCDLSANQYHAQRKTSNILDLWSHYMNKILKADGGIQETSEASSYPGSSKGHLTISITTTTQPVPMHMNCPMENNILPHSSMPVNVVTVLCNQEILPPPPGLNPNPMMVPMGVPMPAQIHVPIPMSMQGPRSPQVVMPPQQPGSSFSSPCADQFGSTLMPPFVPQPDGLQCPQAAPLPLYNPNFSPADPRLMFNPQMVQGQPDPRCAC